jgi:hypothetical protein
MNFGPLREIPDIPIITHSLKLSTVYNGCNDNAQIIPQFVVVNVCDDKLKIAPWIFFLPLPFKNHGLRIITRSYLLSKHTKIKIHKAIKFYLLFCIGVKLGFSL